MPISESAPVSVVVTAENQFSDPLVVDKGDRVSISVSGTFVATIVVQRKFSDQSTFQNVNDGVFTDVAGEKTYVVDEPCELRIGCQTGGYTSGTATGRLGKR